MIIVSQNLTNYDIPVPANSFYRVNLAWVNDLNELNNILEKHKKQKIFLDLPINRTKPPGNNYSIDELIPILISHQNIVYFAISNVESAADLSKYNEIIPEPITLIPKIESTNGVLNIKDIVDSIRGKEKIIMLDHDDLYSSIIKQNKPNSQFKKYVNDLIEFCNQNNISILRTIGVIFSDVEKRVTQYVK